MVLYFYILFQVYEIVNSESEITYTCNPQPGYKYSFIVKLAFLLDPLLVYVPITRNA